MVGNGQPDADLQSAVGTVVYVQIRAVQLGDAPHYGHAEPHSVPLLGIDPIEALAQA
ncbi:hypothetical protein D3C78_1786390 [compost metagenome]